MKRLIRALGVLLLCLLPCTAMSWDFRVADVEGLANVTLAYEEPRLLALTARFRRVVHATANKRRREEADGGATKQ